MRVLTLNLWGRRGDWGARRTVIAEAVRELQPDLVALQEAVVTEEYDQAADLLGPDFELAHRREREEGENGVSARCARSTCS